MTSFEALGIEPDIRNGLEALGFTEPTPVQQQVIPTVLEKGADLVVLAQTGTGKTAAFGVPLLQMCDPRRRQPQALVLCPTRELCLQVTRDLTAFGRFRPALHTVAVYGGAAIDRQITALRQGAQIIVATPGRLHDLLRRRAVDLAGLQTLVLDEADEMLKMGFQDELNAILAETPAAKTTLLFSATMPREVAGIAARYMRNPQEITVGRRNAGADNVRHLYYMVQARDRYPALRRIADSNPQLYAIIFCRTRQETIEVADRLQQDGYNADALHGDLSQAQRDQVMQKFRRRNLELLVATDVAARGLDVTDLTHVINYNLPDTADNYTHRSGRTGRAGKAGISIALIHLREQHKIREIEGRLKVKFEKSRVPTGREVCAAQLQRFVESVQETKVEETGLAPFWPAIAAGLADLDREELIRRFVTTACRRQLEAYQDAPDLNAVTESKTRTKTDRDKKSPNREGDHYSFTRFRLNIGQKDGMHAKRLIGQLNELNGSAHIKLGKIEVGEHSSSLEADSRYSQQVLNAFQHLMINGKHVLIKVDEARPNRRPTGKPAGKPTGKPTENRRPAHAGGKPEKTTDRGDNSFKKKNKDRNSPWKSAWK